MGLVLAFVNHDSVRTNLANVLEVSYLFFVGLAGLPVQPC